MVSSPSRLFTIRSKVVPRVISLTNWLVTDFHYLYLDSVDVIVVKEVPLTWSQINYMEVKRSEGYRPPLNREVLSTIFLLPKK